MKIPGLGNINQLMAQAQAAMEQAQEMERQLADERLEIAAGGGMVKATFNGKGEIQAIVIDKQVVDPEDVEMLQDLVLSVMHEGMSRANALREERLREITGGLPQMPGMKMPF